MQQVAKKLFLCAARQKRFSLEGGETTITALDEIIQRGGKADYEQILAGVRMRDEIDSHRAFSPLRAAEDAIILDSDKLSADEVFTKVEALCR